jgi:endonuclease YncB( thermonuclease family)
MLTSAIRALALAILAPLAAGPSVSALPTWALDGDTIVVGGAAVHIAGIDAPELGPWARCWAEAALAGHARTYVEATLFRKSWRAVEVEPARADGPSKVRMVSGDGDDLADLMVVGGYAARTGGRWDWCGANANLHNPLEGEAVPHGPNLWWPTNDVYDPRAHD